MWQGLEQGLDRACTPVDPPRMVVLHCGERLSHVAWPMNERPCHCSLVNQVPGITDCAAECCEGRPAAAWISMVEVHVSLSKGWTSWTGGGTMGSSWTCCNAEWALLVLVAGPVGSGAGAAKQDALAGALCCIWGVLGWTAKLAVLIWRCQFSGWSAILALPNWPWQSSSWAEKTSPSAMRCCEFSWDLYSSGGGPGSGGTGGRSIAPNISCRWVEPSWRYSAVLISWKSCWRGLELGRDSACTLVEPSKVVAFPCSGSLFNHVPGTGGWIFISPVIPSSSSPERLSRSKLSMSSSKKDCSSVSSRWKVSSSCEQTSSLRLISSSLKSSSPSSIEHMVSSWVLLSHSMVSCSSLKNSCSSASRVSFSSLNRTCRSGSSSKEGVLSSSAMQSLSRMELWSSLDESCKSSPLPKVRVKGRSV